MIRARLIMVLLIAALALGACGRKSALEPPGAPDKKEDAKKRT